MQIYAYHGKPFCDTYYAQTDIMPNGEYRTGCYTGLGYWLVKDDENIELSYDINEPDAVQAFAKEPTRLQKGKREPHAKKPRTGSR